MYRKILPTARTAFERHLSVSEHRCTVVFNSLDRSILEKSCMNSSLQSFLKQSNDTLPYVNCSGHLQCIITIHQRLCNLTQQQITERVLDRDLLRTRASPRFPNDHDTRQRTDIVGSDAATIKALLVSATNETSLMT